MARIIIHLVLAAALLTSPAAGASADDAKLVSVRTMWGPAAIADRAASSDLPAFLASEKRKTLDAEYADMMLKEQLHALTKDPEVLRFQKMRQAKADDPYRPLYHFSAPEGLINDPNGFCYWNGYWHMFYQLQAVGTAAMQWGHAYSNDLVHWKDLPIAIRREDGTGAVFSGQTLVEENRLIAMYHDTVHGNCVAIADDPLLLSFAKMGKWGAGKFTGEGFQKVFDPCIWKGKDGAYYSVSGVCKDGGRTSKGFPVADLFRSEDLKSWSYLGTLLKDKDWTRMGLGPGDDSAVPNFQPLGLRDGTPSGKYMYLWFSHGKGAHAMVGTYDEDDHHFSPESYHRMTYGPVYKGTLHAPSAAVGPDGRLLAIFNIRENMQDTGEALRTNSPKVWYGIMSLARHFWLDDDTLRVSPFGDIESLRFDHRRVSATTIPAGDNVVLDGVRGKAMEIQAVIDPGQAEEVGLTVLRSPDGEERTTIVLHTSRDEQGNRQLEIDVSAGSREGVPPRSPERGPLKLADGKPLELRIFIDRSVIEVFANERQSLTARVYPGREDSTTVSVFAKGGAAELKSLDAWQMRSIWPELEHLEGR